MRVFSLAAAQAGLTKDGHLSGGSADQQLASQRAKHHGRQLWELVFGRQRVGAAPVQSGVGRHPRAFALRVQLQIHSLVLRLQLPVVGAVLRSDFGVEQR